MSDATPSWSRTDASQKQYDLVGGLVLVVAAVILLATSFLLQNPVPLTVRGAVVIFGAVGLAVSMGWLRVLNPQDFYGGMALILLALVAFVASNDLPGMRGFAFGPGTAPRLFAFALALLSLAVVVTGLLTKGPHVTPYNMRGVVFIIGAILAFAATIRPLGLVDRELLLHRDLRGGGRRRAMARDRDLGRRADGVLRVPVSLWPEPAVPALAAVLVIGENHHV